MKSILIVDDEYLVRIGLKTIIDWAEYGYSIIGEAGNGKEALEIFERVGADVILTDIKMPVMGGLELTRAIKEKNKKVQVIILSHYDEFAYAQEAIKLGAFQYILKSELTKTNLVNVLKSLLHASKVEDKNYEEKTTGSPSEKQESYLEQCLFPFISETKADDKNHLPLPDEGIFPNNQYIIMTGSCRTTALLFDARKKFPKIVKALIAEAFNDSVSFGDYHSGGFRFIVILPVSADEPQNTVPDKVVESCSLIMKNVRRYYDIQLLMGLSSVGKMSDIFRLIAESKTALNQCFFSEKNSVITYSRNLLELQGNPPHISYTKLFEMIDMNKKEAMLEYIQNIFRELRKLKNYTYVHDAFIDFLSIGKLIREKYKIQERASLSESKFNYDTFYDIGFIADVEFYVYDIYLSLFMGKQDGEISYSYVVKKCIAFIHTNYCENITLAEVAKAAGVSHGYLSFIFKQETGINFNTYLSQYRVKEAKKLLLSTNMRIYEVAEKVGFSNPYYFSKVFKEFTGITCKEFKDKRSSIEY